ncbi:MAG: hypothetical protein JEZ04_21325 [Spirochaetales bacterium]|nr:hypothetical protein [Spirochaetales bacterium]
MKKLIITLSLIILVFTGCHEFTNPIDPYMGLVAYYPFEGDTKNSADVINNASAKSAELTAGHFADAESAYTLYGDDSYIDCGIIGSLSADNPNLTISLWFKQSESQDYYSRLVGKGEDYYVDFDDNSPSFVMDVGASYPLTITAIGDYNDETWHHLAILGYTYKINSGDDYTRIKMYIDGVYIGSDSDDGDLASSIFESLSIGGNNSGGYSWNGTVDNLRVYNIVLSPIDILKLFMETKDGGTSFDTETLVKSISSGETHTLFVKKNGELWTCGSGSAGQLGLGAVTSVTVPTKITIENVTAAEIGDDYSFALKVDGSVWGWGENSLNELGLGADTADKNTPTVIPGLSSITKISSGLEGSLALNTTGSVYVWGNGLTSTPQQIPDLSDCIDIAAGGGHYLIVKSDGTVVSFGNNQVGQLGDGTTTTATYSSPATVSDMSGVTAVSAGTNFSLALKSDGTVWSWGYNYYGQLGNDSFSDSRIPTQVEISSGYLNDVVQISAGTYHASALKSDGSVMTWGNNGVGQLGDSSSSSDDSEYAVPANLNYTPASIGIIATLGDQSGCSGNSRFGISASGDVIAWGSNSSSQLGLGDTTIPTTTTLVPYF